MKAIVPGSDAVPASYSAFFRAPSPGLLLFVEICLVFAVLQFFSTAAGQTTPNPAGRAMLSTNAEPPTVGMEGRLEVLLPEAGLAVKAPDRRAPMLVRIASTRQHGTLIHYDLRYVGLVPGRHDLRDYLVTTGGGPATNLPALSVSVTGVLPDPHNGWLEDQALRAPSMFGGYRGAMTALVVLWIAALFLIVRYGRKPRTSPIETQTVRPPTLAERLRPLVERAAGGPLSADDQAALERMLITHWQRRLGLDGATGGELIASLRQHPEAGVLLRAFEDWLHRPPGSATVEIESMLAPYRNLPADEPAEVVR